MNHKILKLSCESTVEIYDNCFTESERFHLYSFSIYSNYKFGRTSDESTRVNRPGSFFSCFFSKEDDTNFSFNSKNIVQDITKRFKYKRSWINATIPGSWYYGHVDSSEESITLLYASNLHWDSEHGGETLFYNSYGEKEIVVDFMPGRIIKFDGRLKHKPAMSNGHFEPRYMYTCQYFPV